MKYRRLLLCGSRLQRPQCLQNLHSHRLLHLQAIHWRPQVHHLPMGQGHWVQEPIHYQRQAHHFVKGEDCWDRRHQHRFGQNPPEVEELMLVRLLQPPLQAERSHRHHCWDRHFQSFHRLQGLQGQLLLAEGAEGLQLAPSS
jgi:hypothetical protein